MDQETKKEFETLTKIIKESFGGVETRIDGLERTMNEGFNNIELRLGNTAYDFEVRELDKRLVRVERKLGLET